MNNRSLHWVVPVQTKLCFSEYFHMEKSNDPLSALQCLKNRTLWNQSFDGLCRYHVPLLLISPCLWRWYWEWCEGGDADRDAVLEFYVRLFTGSTGPDFILMDNVQPHREHFRLFVEHFQIMCRIQMIWKWSVLFLKVFH